LRNPGASGGSGASVTIPQSDVDAGVFGEWSATVTHTGGFRSISYTFSTSFQYTDVFDNVTLAELPPGEYVIELKSGEATETLKLTVKAGETQAVHYTFPQLKVDQAVEEVLKQY